jgi:hypothetical protein
MIGMPTKGFVAFALCCFGLIATATAATVVDPLPATTGVVAASNAATPTQETFTITPATGTAAQDLVVTVTDQKVPAALTSATVAITQNDGLVGSATFTSPASSATVSVPAATGIYTVYVFGTPGASVSVGTFTLCVAPKTDPSNCIQGTSGNAVSFAGSIAAQSSAKDPTVSTLSTPLAVTTAGAYTFTFADLQFPVTLTSAPNLALFQGGNAIIPPGQTTPAITSGTSLSLSPGTYTLLAIAQADPNVKAGLYGITIMGPAGGTPLLDTAVPVGLASPYAPINNNPSAQTVTLTVTDYAFPNALTSASALLTAGGTAVGSASNAGGAASFTAPASSSTSPLALWTYANPGAVAGTYSVDLSGGGTDLYTAAQGVGSFAGASGTTFAYAFVPPAPLTSGAYQATVGDLQFPSQLPGLSFAVAQNGVILTQSATAASANFTAVGGPVVLLVSAVTPASGLFDVNIQTTGASATLVYDQTQSVSSTSSPLFYSQQKINLTASGSFDASLTDLKVPAAFDTLALVVSRGVQVLGKVFGGGTLTFPGTVGSYQLTYVAGPSAQQEFGLYGVKVVATPPPTVMLTSNVSTAATGTSITLSWTTANVASCSASGGSWTGSKSTGTGTETLTLAATTTYTLTCTASGGTTAAQSVTVTATAAVTPPSTKSGGGALDLSMVLLCGMLLAARIRRLQRA